MSDHYYDHLKQVYVLWKDSRLSDNNEQKQSHPWGNSQLHGLTNHL